MANSNKSSSILPTNILNTASHSIIVKFTIENYLRCKAQIEPFLKGPRLLDYIDGFAFIPPPSINNAPNPTYCTWVLQDKLIMFNLNSTLSESILAQVIDCKTSASIWSTLQRLFVAKSSAHVVHTQF